MKNIITKTIYIFIGLIIPWVVHAQQVPTPVIAYEVMKKEFIDEIEALGTLKAKQNVDLTSTVTELVTKVSFEDNQRVEAGYVLVEMDASDELAEKVEEMSRLKEAERQVKRLEPLVKRGAASKSSLDAQMLELETSKARMQAIESQIKQRKIIAPFAGVLGQRNISVGTLSQPGTVITTIDADDVMKLDFLVPEIYISELKKNIKIEASSRAWKDEIFEGVISSINSRVDPDTRSVAVRAILQNPEYKLRPGQLIRVKLQKNPRQAIVIPEEAIIIRGNENSVMVIEKKDGKNIIKQQNVQLGTRRKGEVEIISGLQEGNKIVTHGTLRVREGSEVIVKAVEKNNEPLAELIKNNN